MKDRKRVIPYNEGCEWWTQQTKGKYYLMHNDFICAKFQDKKACEVFERDFDSTDFNYRKKQK